MCGQLNVITGPMFAGKSSELIRRMRNAQWSQKNIIIFNYIGDNRYSKEDSVATHNGEYMRAKKVANLGSQDVTGYDVIGIDELHLFPDFETVDRWAQEGKHIEVSLINSGLSRAPIEAFTFVASKATNITFLTSVCDKCFQSASFTTRTAKIRNTLIGGAEAYAPRCAGCWNI